MESVTIGNYKITPQTGDTVSRVIVQRDPNPHNVSALYVIAHFGPEGASSVRYRVTAGETELQGGLHESWDAAITVASNCIENLHNTRESAQAVKDAQQQGREEGKRMADAELRRFLAKVSAESER